MQIKDLFRFKFIYKNRMIEITHHDFRFPTIIVSHIMSSVRSSNLIVLWNGANIQHFTPCRGLCQSNHLSPYPLPYCVFGFAFDRIDFVRIDSNGIYFERIDLCLDTMMYN